MDLDEINKRIKSEVDLLNNRPIDDFEGRTPSEMFYILNKPFDKDSPLKFNNEVDEELLNKIPILKMSIFLLELVQSQKMVKLTTKGNLPLKTVNAIYDLRFFPSEYIDDGRSKIRSEEDVPMINAVRIVCQISSLIKIQHNKLSITAKGKKLLKSENLNLLFRELFVAYTIKFNWAYLNYSVDSPIGQHGFAFSLEVLSIYGNKELPCRFYADKYLKAFPIILEYFPENIYITAEQRAISSYEYKTFDCFMSLFGFVEIIEKGEDKFNKKEYVKKTSMLNHLIRFEE